MCASCLSGADGLLLSSAGAPAALEESRHWLRVRRTTTRAERRAERRAADAAFLREMGLVPDDVLGPTPAPSARERVLVGS